MTVTFKANHVEEALDDLIQELKKKPDLAAWLTAYVNQVQDLEVTFDDVRAMTSIFTAADAQLDTIGALVGEARQGRTDLKYRPAILARVSLNLSEGTQEQIRALIRAVAGDVEVVFFETFPAGFIAQILDPIDPLVVDPERVALLVQSARAAGVGAQTAVSVDPPFSFDAGAGFDLGLWAAVF